MPQTGFCADKKCDLAKKELYECHCCNKLICLNHLNAHVELTKQNKQFLTNELSTTVNKLKIIIDKKLLQIDYENKLIEQTNKLIHSQMGSIDEIKNMFDKINQAITSNHSEDTIVKLEPSLSYDNENLMSVDNTFINKTLLDQTMDEDEEQNGAKQIGVEAFCDRCPLTFDGAFGLTKTKHSLKICSKTKQRPIRLFLHFKRMHRLKPVYARRLVEAMINEQDSMTTKLFNDDEDIIDHFRQIPCPFNDGTMNLFEYNSKKILRVPCPTESIVQYTLKTHLKTYHRLPGSIAQIVHDHVKKLREEGLLISS